MSSVDERIVKMVFDNSEFAGKIASTIGSLTELTKKTNEIASNNGSGLSALSNAFQQAEVMSTKAGFHLRDVWLNVATIFEQQVAGKIVDAGKKIANALTIEGVTDGFREYELKMGSVQTIMAGTGASLQEVNKYLEELNTYSDKTIYSFADMTNNIGKFTNAGVELDDAVLAIKGIANEAARSGANANEASRAMYNFSQALSAGYVKLIDWKSIENANMATKEFKDTLLEVASAVGTVEKGEDGMYKVLGKNANGATMKEAMSATKNFNDSLAYQWMTTDVLTKTMKIYATDVRDMSKAEKEAWESELRSMGMSEEQIKKFEELGSAATDAASEVKTFSMLIDTLKEAIGSGWAQTWEIIIGDFEEAKELWTEVSNVLGGFIDQSSKSRNDLLKGWLDKDELNGRKDLIDALGNAFTFMVNVMRPIGAAMREVFPPATAQQLKNLSTGLLNFTKRLQFSSVVAGKIKNAAKGFFSIFDIGLKFIKAFVNAVLPAGKGLTTLGGSLLDVASNLGKFITNIDESITKGKTFEKLFDSIGKVVKPVVDVIKSGFSGAKDILGGFLEGFTEKAGKAVGIGEILKAFFQAFADGIQNLFDKLKVLKPLLDGLVSIFKSIGRVVGMLFTQLGNSLQSFSSSGGGFALLQTLINGVLSGGILYKMFSGVKTFKSLGDSFSSVLDGLGSALNSFGEKVGSETLLNTAKAVAILAGSLLVVAMIDSDKLAGATTAIAAMVGVLAGAMIAIMKAVSSFSATDVKKSFNIFGKELFSSTKAIEMAVTLQAVSKALIAMGAAILMMAVGLKVVSSAAEGGHLWDSFAVVSLMLAELTGVAIVLGKWGNESKKGATDLISMTAALILMAEALKMVSKVVEGGNAWEALGILSLMLGELTGVVLLVENFSKVQLGGMGGLIALAVSLNLVVFALKSVSDALGTEGNRIWESLGVISIILAELTGVVLLMSNFGGMAALGGAGAIMAAAALLIVVQALKQISDALGKQDQHIWQALAVIGTSLVVLAVGLTLMAGTIPGAVGLLVASAALVVLGGALKIMGSMSLAEIGKGLLVLAGSLVLLAVGLTAMVIALPGAAALTVAAFGLTILAGALKLLGSIKLLEILKALGTLAISLAAIAVLGTVLSVTTPLLLAFSVAIGVFGAALLASGVGITLFATGLQALVAIVPMGVIAIEALAKSLLGLIPIIAENLMEALGIIATKIVEYGPAFTQATVTVIGFILTALSESANAFGEAVMTVILGILNTITVNIPLIAQAGADMMIAFTEAISTEIPRVVDEAYKCAIALIEGLATAIDENNTELIEAVDHLMSSVIQAITQWLVEFTPLGLLMPEEMKNGIMSGELNVKDALDNVIKKAIEGIKEKVADFKAAAKDFIGGFIEGLEDVPLIGGVVKAAANLGAKAVEALRSKKGVDAHSNSHKTIPIGHDTGGGFIEGMEDMIPGVEDAAAQLGSSSIDSLTDSVQNGLPDLENSAGDVVDTFVKPITDAVTSGTEATDNYSKSFDRNRESLEKLDKQIHLSSDAEKELQGETLKAEKAMIRQNNAIEDHRDATLDDVKAMKSAHDQAATLHERKEQMKDGEYKLTKETKANTEATKENTEAQDANTEATGKNGKATKKTTDFMTEASGVIEAFVANYGDLSKELGKTDAVDAATFAVKNMAEEAYKASLKTKDATDSAKDSTSTLEEITKVFTDMKKKVFDSVKSYFEGDNFFQKFEVKTGATMKSLLENMKSNIDGVTSWSNKLSQLADKGLSQGFLQHLAELGPKGFEYVNAFSTATTEEIQQANAMFEQAAVLPDSLSNNVLASYARAGLNVVQGFADGISKNTGTAVDALDNVAETALPSFQEKLGEASPSKITYLDGLYLIQGLNNGIQNNAPTVVSTVNALGKRIVDTISKALDRSIFVGYGKNVAYGLAEGMSDDEAVKAVNSAATALSSAASKATTKYNEINSPSRLYRMYGDYIAQGLAMGMEDGTTYVEDSATTLAESIRGSIALVQDIVEDEIDMNPVISPVLDLSNLKNKAGQINGLFPSRSIAMASSIGIGAQNGSTSGVSEAIPVAGTTQVNFTQNNYSPKALSQIDIYRQTKNQVSMLKGALANG